MSSPAIQSLGPQISAFANLTIDNLMEQDSPFSLLEKARPLTQSKRDEDIVNGLKILTSLVQSDCSGYFPEAINAAHALIQKESVPVQQECLELFKALVEKNAGIQEAVLATRRFYNNRKIRGTDNGLLDALVRLLEVLAHDRSGRMRGWHFSHCFCTSRDINNQTRGLKLSEVLAQFEDSFGYIMPLVLGPQNENDIAWQRAKISLINAVYKVPCNPVENNRYFLEGAETYIKSSDSQVKNGALILLTNLVRNDFGLDAAVRAIEELEGIEEVAHNTCLLVQELVTKGRYTDKIGRKVSELALNSNEELSKLGASLLLQIEGGMGEDIAKETETALAGSPLPFHRELAMQIGWLRV